MTGNQFVSMRYCLCQANRIDELEDAHCGFMQSQIELNNYKDYFDKLRRNKNRQSHNSLVQSTKLAI